MLRLRRPQHPSQRLWTGECGFVRHQLGAGGVQRVRRAGLQVGGEKNVKKYISDVSFSCRTAKFYVRFQGSDNWGGQVSVVDERKKRMLKSCFYKKIFFRAFPPSWLAKKWIQCFSIFFLLKVQINLKPPGFFPPTCSTSTTGSSPTLGTSAAWTLREGRYPWTRTWRLSYPAQSETTTTPDVIKNKETCGYFFSSQKYHRAVKLNYRARH